MQPHFSLLNRCLACDKCDLLPVLDLGSQPLANEYRKKPTKLPAFPLAIRLCPHCFHVQQEVAVNPDLMFRNYLYVSGTSTTMREYFSWFAEKVHTQHTSGAGKVLDIACNDGSQLAAFIARGWRGWGVDPARNLLKYSRATGATVVCDYWTQEAAGALPGPFDCILAQNVFAHTADPLSFLKAAKLAMHPGSRLFIQTSQADMFSRGEFDTIYHEHLSFFSARSMQTIAKRAGLILEDIWITPIHGGSYVFVLGHGNPGPNVAKRIAEEKKAGRYRIETYRRFGRRAREIVRTLRKKLDSLRDKGYPTVGFGAAAKGNTLLNFGSIALDYIVDDNPLKHGLYTPGMNIPIRAPSHLAKEKGDAVVVPLAWNFFEEIRAKVQLCRPRKKDIFVTYFPKVELHRFPVK